MKTKKRIKQLEKELTNLTEAFGNHLVHHHGYVESEQEGAVVVELPQSEPAEAGV